MRQDVEITADGDTIAAWHFTPDGEDAALRGACVVMAHGFGATRDCGIEPFAQAFAAAGAHVLLFDYRHFGASGGHPRQLLSVARQRADYRAVIAHARTLPGVDPERVVAWGVSLSGGHVLQVAAEDPRIAAVIAMTPSPDGLASTLAAFRREGPLAPLRMTAAGLKDAAAAIRRRPPVTIPTFGHAGDTAVITAPGAEEQWREISGPEWRNGVCARVLLTFGNYRPTRFAKRLTQPLLVQVGDRDQTAPPAAAMAAAVKGRAEVHHLPADHFDVYAGRPQHDAAVRQQVAFLRRHLGVAAAEREAQAAASS